MRAGIFRETGGPEVVETAEVETPEPGPGEVRVAVRASSMNHLDLWVRRGLPVETTWPHIGGSDIAGEVDARGPGAEDVPEGIRVVVNPSLDYETYDGTRRGPSFPERVFHLIGEHTQGGFAEYAVVPAANLVEIPDGVPFETAAAAGLVTVTAWRGLVKRGGLRAGERALITAASGGVGTVAVQIARRAGARVHAVTSGPQNVERVRGLGADHAYDRLEGEWSAAVWADTGERGVDLAFDSVGAAMWEENLKALAVGGRLVTYGATTGADGPTEIRRVFWKQLSIVGTTMGTPSEFREAMGLVFRGEVEPVIHEVVPLDELARAHEMLEEGDVFGKLVIVP